MTDGEREPALAAMYISTTSLLDANIDIFSPESEQSELGDFLFLWEVSKWLM